jgi:hypothetical protein
MNGSGFNLNCILWSNTENFSVILELLLGKIKKMAFPLPERQERMKRFVICCTPEDTIAILEPVMVGQ